MSDAGLTGLPAVDASNSAAGRTRERSLLPTRKEGQTENRMKPHITGFARTDYSIVERPCKKAKGSGPGGTKDADVGHVCQRGASSNP
jgi:hypothetical protein